jgi:hypothetical protein
MPLTPASWAGDLPGAASKPSTATVTNATRPVIHPRDKIETSCARLMDRYPFADLSVSIHGKNWEAAAEVPGEFPKG